MTVHATKECTRSVAILLDLSPGTPDERRRASRHVTFCATCNDSVSGSTITERMASNKVRKHSLVPAVRVLLGICALTQCVVAVPWLFGTDMMAFAGHQPSPDHLTRDGAFGIAVAVLGALAVWRPRWSKPLAGAGTALLALQAITGAVDQHAGKVSMHFEALHLLVVALVVFLVLSAVSSKTPLKLMPPTKVSKTGVLTKVR